MAVLTIGANTFAEPAYQIEFADVDAGDLGLFFSDKVKKFSPFNPRSIVRKQATAAAVLDALQALLEGRLNQGSLGNNDVVIVSIESHIQKIDGETMLLGSDWNGPGGNAVRASEVTRILKELRGKGCWIVLLLRSFIHQTTSRTHRTEADRFDEGMGT